MVLRENEDNLAWTGDINRSIAIISNLTWFYREVARYSYTPAVSRHIGPHLESLHSFANMDPARDVNIKMPTGISRAVNTSHQVLRNLAREVSEFMLERGEDLGFDPNVCPFSQAEELSHKDGMKIKLDDSGNIKLPGEGVEGMAVFLGLIAKGYASRLFSERLVMRDMLKVDGEVKGGPDDQAVAATLSLMGRAEKALAKHGHSLAEFNVGFDSKKVRREFERQKGDFRAIYNFLAVRWGHMPTELKKWLNPDRKLFFTDKPQDIACLITALVNPNIELAKAMRDYQGPLMVLAEEVAKCANNRSAAQVLNKAENIELLARLKKKVYLDGRYGKVIPALKAFAEKELTPSQGEITPAGR